MATRKQITSKGFLSTEPLDEYQQYLDGVGTLAQRASDRRSECHNVFEVVEKEIGSASNDLRTLVECRGSQMTEQDQKDAGGLLETGFFVGEEESFRAAAIVTCFEFDHKLLTLELFPYVSCPGLPFSFSAVHRLVSKVLHEFRHGEERHVSLPK